MTDAQLLGVMRDIFIASKNDIFHDGADSAFSLKLMAYMTAHKIEAISIIETIIFNEQVSDNVISEALRWVGKFEDKETHLARRDLLERSLNLVSPIAKDGAILGLSFMDDPNAISALEHALENENLKSVKDDIQQVLDQLYETRQGS